MAFHDHFPQDMTYEQQQQQQQQQQQLLMMSNSPAAAFRALRPPNDPLAGQLPSPSINAGKPHASAGDTGPSSASSWLQAPRQHPPDVGGFLHEPRGAEEAIRRPGAAAETTGEATWRHARCKADVAGHPLFEQLLAAHVACLRVATPVDQLPRIDAQLAQSHEVAAKYAAMAATAGGNPIDGKELDQFMAHYVLLLCSFKEQLQQHVRVHAMEAVMACWEIEQSLQNLTVELSILDLHEVDPQFLPNGASPGEGTGATMSDDEEDQMDSDINLFDGGLQDGPESMGFGLPTESERCLMERVRQELKLELKQGYKEKLVDIREEILRKRRAGKLPGDSTSLLKAWWQSHSKWPYPTEEDKARLMQETGLQLKQINNWFINQRKRNWHSNPSSSSTGSKSKHKR